MSAVVAPSNFLRLKYRPKPLHPELDENEAVYDTSHSIAKKVKPVLGDELAELRAPLSSRCHVSGAHTSGHSTKPVSASSLPSQQSQTPSAMREANRDFVEPRLQRKVR